jgi:hypothetical protein
MAKWQASKSDMSPRKGYIPEIDYDDDDVSLQDMCETCDSRGTQTRVHPTLGHTMKFCKNCVKDHDQDMIDYYASMEDEPDEPGTDSDNKAASNAVADAFPGLDDSAKGLMGLSAVSTPRGERSPLDIPMNWEK